MQITWVFIILNLIAFVLQQFGIFTGMSFTPATFTQEPWTILTSMFMHGSGQHLLLNMFGLWMFGSVVEHELGKKKWLIIYFFSGFLGSSAYILFGSSPFISAIGASGAIFGLIGAAAILKPKMIVWTTFGPIPMIIAAVLWGTAEFIGFFGIDTVAQSAHIGGLIGGVVMALFLITKIKEKLAIPIVFIPVVLALMIGFSIPSEISSYIDVPQGYALQYTEHDIDTKLNFYAKEDNHIITITSPSRGKFNLAEYTEELDRTVNFIYLKTFKKQCPGPMDYNIKTEDETAMIEGEMCSQRFRAFSRICPKNVDVQIIEFYEDEPDFADVVSCTGLSS